MENNIFRDNQKSADRVAKFEYFVKSVTYLKSPDNIRYVNIFLSLKLFEHQK